MTPRPAGREAALMASKCAGWLPAEWQIMCTMHIYHATCRVVTRHTLLLRLAVLRVQDRTRVAARGLLGATSSKSLRSVGRHSPAGTLVRFACSWSRRLAAERRPAQRR